MLRILRRGWGTKQRQPAAPGGHCYDLEISAWDTQEDKGTVQKNAAQIGGEPGGERLLQTLGSVYGERMCCT